MSLMRSLVDYSLLTIEEWRLGQEVTDDEFYRRYSQGTSCNDYGPGGQSSAGPDVDGCPDQYFHDRQDSCENHVRAEEL